MNLDELIVVSLLTLIRVAAFVGVLPVFSGTPRLVKVALVCGVTLGFAPWTVQSSVPQWVVDSAAGLALAVTRECLLGISLGFAFGILLEPIKVAGSYLDHQIGFSFGATVDPNLNQSASLVGQVWEAMAILLMMALDVHRVMFAALAYSWECVPLGSALTTGAVALHVQHGIRIPEVGILLAFPLGLWLFLASIFSAVLMRAAPQFHFFSVGFTLRIGAGLAGLVLMCREFVAMAVRLFSHAQDLAADILGVL